MMSYFHALKLCFVIVIFSFGLYVCVSDLAILLCGRSMRREGLLCSVLASEQFIISLSQLLVQCSTVNLDLY